MPITTRAYRIVFEGIELVNISRYRSFDSVRQYFARSKVIISDCDADGDRRRKLTFRPHNIAVKRHLGSLLIAKELADDQHRFDIRCRELEPTVDHKD